MYERKDLVKILGGATLLTASYLADPSIADAAGAPVSRRTPVAGPSFSQTMVEDAKKAAHFIYENRKPVVKYVVGPLATLACILSIIAYRNTRRRLEGYERQFGIDGTGPAPTPTGPTPTGIAPGAQSWEDAVGDMSGRNTTVALALASLLGAYHLDQVAPLRLQGTSVQNPYTAAQVDRTPSAGNADLEYRTVLPELHNHRNMLYRPQVVQAGVVSEIAKGLGDLLNQLVNIATHNVQPVVKGIVAGVPIGMYEGLKKAADTLKKDPSLQHASLLLKNYLNRATRELMRMEHINQQLDELLEGEVAVKYGQVKIPYVKNGKVRLGVKPTVKVVRRPGAIDLWREARDGAKKNEEFREE